jgi:hypothetical protein
MTNNVFRKGLVAAAIVALGSTGLVAAPAQAASVLFAPTTGTGNTTIAGETFSLTASLSSDLPAANAAQLKFAVTNTTGVAATIAIDTHSGSSLTAKSLTPSGTTAAGDVWATAPAAGTTKVFADAQSVNPYQAITITSAAATTADYTVVAFADTNNNGTADLGELSASQTVHFVKVANAGSVVTFTQPTQTSAALKATVAFGADVNAAQLALANIKVGFGVYNVGGEVSAYNAAHVITQDLRAVTYSSTTKVFTTEATDATPAPVTGKTFGAQLYYSATGASHAAVGTEVLQVVAATDSNSISALKPAVGDNVKQDGSTVTYDVRTGTTSVALTATVKKNTSSTDTTQVAVGAGVPVKYSVDAATFATASGATVADTITVNGVAITSASTFPVTGTVYTAADGTISIPVVTGAGVAGDRVAISYSLPNGVIASVSGVNTVITGSVNLLWADVTGTTVTGLGTNKVIVKGSAISETFKLTDNNGALITTADKYQLLVRIPGATGTTAPTATAVYVPFVGGVATLSATDNSTGTGSNAITYELLTKTSGVYVASGTQVADTYTVVAAAPAVAALTATNSADATTSDNNARDTAATFANLDNRVGNGTAPAVNSAAKTVSGVATDANGVGVAGANVVITAAGIQFEHGGIWTIGSATVVTDASGNYTVNVYSHTAGKVTFTATVGSVSKTTSITWAKAAADKGATLVITAPATATPGSTVNFSAVLADKYGNPVAVATGSGTNPTVSLKATGLGVASNATSTDATGTATGYVTLGAGDAGTITVTATYDADGTTAASTVTATAKIVVAAPAVPSAAKTALAVGADQAQVGAAVDVIATATDAAGKAVAGVVVTFDNVGQGYLSATSATTDANGVAKVKLVGNVAGRNTLTATANGATAANAGVSYGAADANITVKGKRATVTYEYAGLAKVVVSVNGTRKPAVYPADDNECTYSFNLKAGTNKIVVSIAGKTVDSKTVKIKK